jgi:hypothetical protein
MDPLLFTTPRCKGQKAKGVGLKKVQLDDRFPVSLKPYALWPTWPDIIRGLFMPLRTLTCPL